MSMRRAVIAVADLHEGDRVQIGTELLTLTDKPHVICGDRWSLRIAGSNREYFEDSITIIVPSSRDYTQAELDELHACAEHIDRHMQTMPARYTVRARAAFLNGWTESKYVDTEATGPTHWGFPEPGQFVLVPNAGGRHQSPGSYGYTRTEVLDVKRNTAAVSSPTHRVVTRAFGSGCWTTGDYLICGHAPAE